MRRDEEIVDACIALGIFLLLCVMYCCISKRACIRSFCGRMVNCLFCRNWSPPRVQSYNDLEELLFDVDEDAGGRLIGSNDEVAEITVCNFFCDVLKQKPKRPIVRLPEGESQDPNNMSRFSEPLL